MKKLSVLLLMTFVLLAGCKNNIKATDPIVHDLPPLNGKKVLVVSDIHMGDKRSIDNKYGWFTGENRDRFIAFLDYVISKKDEVGQLVFNGDVFDEWVAPMQNATFVNKKNEVTTSESEFFSSILAANSQIIDKLKQVKAAGVALIYVPGNHDMLVTRNDLDKELGGLFYQARDADGLGTYRPQSMPEVAIEHGHRYDFFNAPDPLSASGTILPAGFFVTKYACSVDNNTAYASGNMSLENFDLDAYLSSLSKEELDQLPDRASIAELIAEILKYYQYWVDIANGKYPADADYYNAITHKAAWAMVLYQKFDLEFLFWDNRINCNIAPYDKEYNLLFDVLPFFSSVKLYTESMKSAKWAARCKVNNAVPHVLFPLGIAAGGINTVAHQMSLLQYFRNNTSNTRVVVFGHTHEVALESMKDNSGRLCIYANSGTWIDQKAAGKDKTCTFVEIDKPNDTYIVETKQFVSGTQITTLNRKSFQL